MFLKDMSVFTALTRNMDWLSARQKVLSQNIANADTPGYRSKDLKPMSFQDLVRGSSERLELKKTHPNHIQVSSTTDDGFGREKADGYEATPNANSVVLEDEIIKVNDARMSYDLATSLYRKHVQMLKMAIGGRGG